MMMIWRNRRTGKHYRMLAMATDSTNLRCGNLMVVYCPDDDGNTIYVRDEEEFMRKFECINAPAPN